MQSRNKMIQNVGMVTIAEHLYKKRTLTYEMKHWLKNAQKRRRSSFYSTRLLQYSRGKTVSPFMAINSQFRNAKCDALCSHLFCER